MNLSHQSMSIIYSPFTDHLLCGSYCAKSSKLEIPDPCMLTRMVIRWGVGEKKA